MEGILSCLVLRAPVPDGEDQNFESKFGSCSWLCSVPQTTMVPGAPPAYSVSSVWLSCFSTINPIIELDLVHVSELLS